MGFATTRENKAICHGGTFPCEAAELAHIHLDFGKRRAAFQWHHQIEDAGGDTLGFEVRVEVFWRKAECLGERSFLYFCGFEGGFSLRHGDAVRPAVFEADLDRKNSCAGLLHEVHAALLFRDEAEFREEKPRADDGMACEF